MLIVENLIQKQTLDSALLFQKVQASIKFPRESTYRKLPGKYIAMHCQILYSSTTLDLIWIVLILYSMDLII